MKSKIYIVILPFFALMSCSPSKPQVQSTKEAVESLRSSVFTDSTAVVNDGFTLNWKSAGENVTYCLCEVKNLKSALDTNVCNKSSLVMDCKLNATSFSVSGKASDKTYYYNVIAKRNGLSVLYNGKAQKTLDPSALDVSDVDPPSIGYFNAIATPGVTTLDVSWTAATDNKTAASDLYYLLCSASTAAAIDTINECLGADQVMPFAPGVTSFSVTQLTPLTSYAFNVVVQDQAGLRSLYPGVSATTAAGNAVPQLAITEPAGSDDTVALNGSFQLTWTPSDADDDATVTLYYKVGTSSCTDGSLTGWTQIATSLMENSTTTYMWNTSGIASGSYSICGKIDDGTNTPVYVLSPSFLRINAPPSVSIATLAGGALKSAGYTINYSPADTDDNATVSLYSSSAATNCDSSLTGWTQIATGLMENVTSSYAWNTSSVAVGSYYICGKIDDGVNTAVYAVSSSAISLVNAAAVTGVTTTLANGSYTAAQVIPIKLTFDRSVTVTGSPTLLLETGTTDRSATYSSGSGSAELIFNYTVQAGDASSDLDVHATSPQLSLNGGSITSTDFGFAVSLTVPKAAESGSLASNSTVVIDTVAPTVATLTIGVEDITNLTIRSRWTAASDNITSTASLQYKLVSSSTDNISTVADAEANGTTVMDWTVNTLVATRSSLVKATTYYFNVIVRDAAGNKSLYTRVAATTETMCGGTGTSGDPYQICTLGDLHSMRDYLSSFFIVNNDIDASTTATWNSSAGWVPVGDGTTQFTGGFNGGNKVIRGLTSLRPTTDHVGLFGFINSNNTFEAIGLQNVNISGKDSVGGFMGRVSGTPVLRYLYTTGTVVGDTQAIYRGTGGLIGTFSAGALTYSFSTANVSKTTTAGNAGIGGLVGHQGGSIAYSYATGKVSSAGGTTTGGLVGNSQGTGVTYSYATGNVEVSNGLGSGGLIGFLYNTGSVSYSFATGNVRGGVDVGGLVGTSGRGISYSLATGHVFAATDYSGGLVGWHRMYGPPTISYSLATGRNLSTQNSRGALIGLKSAAPAITLTKTYAYDHGNGLNCNGEGADANCTLVSTGTVKPFAFRFAPELEYVQMKYLESPSVAMRKISSLDASAYRFWGSCTIQGSTINIAATEGAATVNATTTCSAYSWDTTVNLSTLADGAVTVTANENGANTKTLNLTKETSYCDGNPSNGDFAAGNGTVGTPYLICTTAQFDKVRNYLAAGTHFQLQNSLDLSQGFSGPIGSQAVYPTSYFRGSFDGSGFIMRNAMIVTGSTQLVGIFGASLNGTISTLGVEDSHMVGIGTVGVGLLIGSNNSDQIQNCYTSGGAMSTTSSSYGAGGFAGGISGPTTGSASFAHVISGPTGGGFVASHSQNTISQSLSTGHVISPAGSGSFVGIIAKVGATFPPVISSSMAQGHTISSNGDGGGAFAGMAYYRGDIFNSRSSGSVLTNGVAGGFVGHTFDYAYAFDIWIRYGLSEGHAISPSSVGGGFAGSIGTDAAGGSAKIILQNVIGIGHVSGNGATSGGILGQSINTNATLSTVTDGFFWTHSGLPASCIGTNANVTDPVTCNDVGTGLDYSTFSNFTSATAIYSGWDFTNTWKWPAAGGLPILKWQYEP